MFIIGFSICQEDTERKADDPDAPPTVEDAPPDVP